MRNQTLMALAMATTLSTATAQKFYIGAKVGYALGTAKNYIAQNSSSEYVYDQNNSANSYNVYTNELKQQSLGEGFTPSIQVGYLFSKYVGAELNAGYLFGHSFDASSHYINSNYNNSGTVVEDNKYSIKATSFYLNPAFVIRVPTESKFVPYAKLGLYLGLANTTKTESTSNESNLSSGATSNTIGSGTNTGSGNINLGYTGTLGCDYMLTDKLALFGEFNLIAASFSLKKFESNSVSTTTNSNNSNISTYNSSSSYEVVDQYVSDSRTTSTSNSTPITGSDISYGTKTIDNYSDGRQTVSTYISYTNGNSSNTYASTGGKTTSINIPLSSIGLSLGVRYYFGK